MEPVNRPQFRFPWWAAITASAIVTVTVAFMVVSSLEEAPLTESSVVRVNGTEIRFPSYTVTKNILKRAGKVGHSGPTVIPQPLDACSQVINTIELHDAVALVKLGNCDYLTQVLNVQVAKPKIILLEATDILDTSFLNHPEIKVATGYVSSTSLEALGTTYLGTSIYYYLLRLPFLDPGLFLLFAVAVTTVALAADWTEYRYFKALDKSSAAPAPGSSQDEDAPQKLTLLAVGALVVQLVAIILLLYFFPGVLIYVAIAGFCLLSWPGLYQCLKAILAVLPMTNTPRARALLSYPSIRIHAKLPPVVYADIALLSLSLIVVIIWIVVRQQPGAWILQDILDICAMLYMLQTISLPNLKIATVLLTLVFIYDIVFVFTNIMESVALQTIGGDQIPLLLRMPSMMNELGGFSMLGLGDVVLPGLLIIFCRVYDLQTRKQVKFYFMISIFGYCVGLQLTLLALGILRFGQPALLYIVPCTLIPVIVTGWRQGELKALWHGHSAALEEQERQRRSGVDALVQAEEPLRPSEEEMLDENVHDVHDRIRLLSRDEDMEKQV